MVTDGIPFLDIRTGDDETLGGMVIEIRFGHPAARESWFLQAANRHVEVRVRGAARKEDGRGVVSSATAGVSESAVSGYSNTQIVDSSRQAYLWMTSRSSSGDGWATGLAFKRRQNRRGI